MPTTITVKGQVTIPKRVRDELGLKPGTAVQFKVGSDGNVVIEKAGGRRKQSAGPFEAARGTAQVPWRTDELMALLRGDR